MFFLVYFFVLFSGFIFWFYFLDLFSGLFFGFIFWIIFCAENPFYYLLGTSVAVPDDRGKPWMVQNINQKQLEEIFLGLDFSSLDWLCLLWLAHESRALRVRQHLGVSYVQQDLLEFGVSDVLRNPASRPRSVNLALRDDPNHLLVNACPQEV